MADTNQTHLGNAPVEGDGISYRGVIWFVAVLAITTVASQLLMVILFKYMDRDVTANDVPRAPLSAPAGQPPPGPNLLTDEPGNLAKFREGEEQKLNNYRWIDKNAGTVRIPIDRAKELLLQRGLPVRAADAGTPAPGKPAAAPQGAAAGKAPAAAAKAGK